MTLQEIYSNLCSKDKRSPSFEDLFYEEGDELPIPRVGCFCDNCFYGRDKLALEILKLKEDVYRK
jgi:hypothetical protein